MKSMGVVGSGQMGSGIAQLGIVHGIDVWLIDSDPNALARASKSISSNIQRLVSKGLLSQVPSQSLSLSSSPLNDLYYGVFLHLNFKIRIWRWPIMDEILVNFKNIISVIMKKAQIHKRDPLLDGRWKIITLGIKKIGGRIAWRRREYWAAHS